MALTGVTDVSADRHTCARKTDGTLWCWGENNVGALGDGTTDGELCDGRCRTRPVRVLLLCP